MYDSIQDMPLNTFDTLALDVADVRNELRDLAPDSLVAALLNTAISALATLTMIAAESEYHTRQGVCETVDYALEAKRIAHTF